MNNIPFKLVHRDYAVLNLKKNPFPYSGVPDTNPTFYIGQTDVLSSIIQTLSTTILTGKSSHIILTGPYGCGKSHTLLYIKEQLKAYEFENGNTPIIGYISQPGDTMLDIYRDFMYDLGLETLQKYAQEYLCQIATNLIETKKIEGNISLPVVWEDIEEGYILLSDLVPTAVMRLNESAKYVDFCKAFINLVYEENALTAWEWISGEGTDYTKRKYLSLSKNIDAKSVGRAFQAIKIILKILGYRPIILLIDEFEAIENFPSNTKQALLNGIRHLIDVNGTDLSVILACAPDVWQSLVSEYHAFSERIGKETCLKPLTVEKTKNLILAYLEHEVLDAEKPLDCFDEGVYQTLFERGMGNSRQILTLCGKLIDFVIDNGKEKITPTVVEELLLQ